MSNDKVARERLDSYVNNNVRDAVSGNVQILQRKPVDFANAAEYEAQLDDAFKDAEIVKLIA
jgi:hypothetical protein